MADTKISAAADAGTLVATDKVPLTRSASTTAYSATMAEIATWANTNLPVASTTTAGVVKVDGSTITIASGVIASVSPVPSGSLPAMDGTAAAGSAPAWSRGDHVHPIDTSRAPLASPPFTGTPTAPTPTTGDNSTKLATTAFVQAQMVASGAGVSTWNTRAGAVVLQQSDLVAQGDFHDVGRNLVMNGAFAIQQRGAGSWTASGYTADRWVQYVNVSTVSTNINALNDANRTAIGDENARYSLTSAFTGTAGAADAVFFYHPIEGARRLSGKTVTLSFWAATASGTVKLGASIDLIPGTGGSPSANVLGNGQIVTVTAAYTRYSLTFSVPSSVGLTLGTNGNDSTNLNLWLTTGANFNTRSGNVGVQSGTVNIYGVQLEIGSVATPFDAGGTPQQQLAACQRFYQSGWLFNAAGANNGSAFQTSYIFPVQMRATPTMAIVSNTSSGVSSFTLSANTSQCWNGGAATGTAATVSCTFTASADL